MTTKDGAAPPTRGKQHEALDALLGVTVGTPKQTEADPRGRLTKQGE